MEGVALPDVDSYEPIIIKGGDFEVLQALVQKSKPVLHDELRSQIRELIKIRNPKEVLKSADLDIKFQEWAESRDVEAYGLYVYYPWSNKLVHIITKEEFIELRTSRNKYKITEEEQALLNQKKIGIIGLSVGQSVALTMATERIFGTIRLADFDHLELTNLNRIRAGVASLGLPKTIVVAREIAEMDPFLKIELYPEGITTENIDDFLGEGEMKLDLLVEVCDSLPIKIVARHFARKQKIPVIMDTSDRGMVDVERFDNEPEREILHGKVGIENIDELNQLSKEEMTNMLMRMVDFENLSDKMKYSFSEVGKSITTWPQLASDVIAGGGISTKIARRILLGEKIKSNRYYLDRTEEI